MRRTTNNRRILGEVSTFKLCCRIIVLCVRRLSGTNKTGITFNRSNVRTITTRMIRTIRVRLPTCRLIRRTLKMFVLRGLGNRYRLSIRFLISAFRRRRKSIFIKSTLRSNVFRCIKRKSITSIIRRSDNFRDFNFTIRSGISFNNGLLSNLARWMRNSREILRPYVLHAKVCSEKRPRLLSAIWALRGKVSCGVMRRPL